MSGIGAADAAPAGDADPSVDAGATRPADVEAPAPSAAKPAKAPERQRPAHVVPGGSDAASGPGVPAFVAAVHARDAAAARATISKAFQGKANGRPMDADAQMRLLESFWTGFPDGNFTMEPTGGSGRYVITWTFQGTHGGMYLGVPPTGTPVAFSGFIIAVGDKSGVTSLDWKWDTKVFTRAVLGPDQVGDLEVKDNFRDPSKRWAQGRSPGPSASRRRKGKGRNQGQPGQGRQQGGRPQGAPAEGPAEPGQAAATGEPGQPAHPGQRQRRPKKPREPRPDQPGTPGEPQRTQSAAGEGSSDASTSPAADSAPSAAPEAAAAHEPSSAEPKPDGT